MKELKRVTYLVLIIWDVDKLCETELGDVTFVKQRDFIMSFEAKIILMWTTAAQML